MPKLESWREKTKKLLDNIKNRETGQSLETLKIYLNKLVDFLLGLLKTYIEKKKSDTT